MHGVEGEVEEERHLTWGALDESRGLLAEHVGEVTPPLMSHRRIIAKDLAVAASLGGQVDRREYRVLDQTDALAVQVVSDQGDVDQDFRYVDLDNPQPGDYYYVRVRQVDGAMAWSSPFWVGETPASDSN